MTDGCEELSVTDHKRAKQAVRYMCKQLSADHMLTFTYRENVEDRAKVAADWKEFVRLFRFRYPDWKYLAVLEKQERGAYHIHVAVHARLTISFFIRAHPSVCGLIRRLG